MLRSALIASIPVSIQGVQIHPTKLEGGKTFRFRGRRFLVYNDDSGAREIDERWKEGLTIRSERVRRDDDTPYGHITYWFEVDGTPVYCVGAPAYR